MQNIDVNVIIGYIDGTLIEYYNNELASETGKTIAEYIVALELNYRDYIEDLSGSRRAIKKARVNTRLNWYNCAIRDLKAGNAGSYPVIYYDYLVGNGSPDLTWNDFKDEYILKVNEWRDNDCLLIEFPFLSVGSLFKKESAFTKEVTLNIIDAFENMTVEELNVVERAYNKEIFLQPLEFFLGPFVSINSPGSLLKEKGLDENNLLIKYEDYKVPYVKGTDNIVIRSLVYVNDITEQKNNILSLTVFDVSLLLYIVNYIYEVDYITYLQTGKFQNYLVDIVRAMYPDVKKLTSWHYQSTCNSLTKISSLNIRGYKNDELVSMINFFDSYSLDTEEGGKRVVTLSTGSYLFERISQKKIQHIYSHEVALIEDKSAQFVYYIFEGERQKAYANNSVDVPHEYNYSFFLHNMRFPRRSTVKANMDLIESIFNLFMELNVVFASYERRPKCFIVIFKPFTRNDIMSLNLDPPALLHV